MKRGDCTPILVVFVVETSNHCLVPDSIINHSFQLTWIPDMGSSAYAIHVPFSHLPLILTTVKIKLIMLIVVDSDNSTLLRWSCQPDCSCHIFCDLVDLVSSSGSATIYPFDDVILAVLQAYFHADLPYTRTDSTKLLIINPYKTLANVNDLSAKEYKEHSYEDTSPLVLNSPSLLQPNLYDVAARVYLLMHHRNKFQASVTRFVS
jgi:hypothetical protein